MEAVKKQSRLAKYLVGDSREKKRKHITPQYVITKILFYLLLLVLCVIFLFPIVWMVMNSLKTHAGIYSDMDSILTFLPSRSISEWFLSYKQLFTLFDEFGRAILNSFIYCAVTIVGVLIINSLAGYALARIKFPGCKTLVTIILLLLIIPVETSIIPTYVILKTFGLLNHGNFLRIVAYLLPGLCSPMYIFQFRAFFMGIPQELEEAAAIDGCSRLGTFFKIIIPCALPVFATVAIFTFMGQWNEYVFAQLMFSDPKMQPLQVYLQLINGRNPKDLSLILASLTFSTVPIAIVYIICQRWIVEGVAFSGLK